MPPSPASRQRQGRGAQRPAQSAPAERSQQSTYKNSPDHDIAVQGQRVQLHPRSAARSRPYTAQQQQGQYYYAAAPGAYHPAAGLFNLADQEQLLAAYVALMQSPNGTPRAGEQQQHQRQHVLSGNGGQPGSIGFFQPAVIDWNGVISRQGSIATSGR